MSNLNTSKLDVKLFDRFLSDVSTNPEWILMNPKIWNGYWGIKQFPKWVRIIGKYLGRKFHNKYLYWIGLPLYWIRGFGELLPDDWAGNVELINLDD